MVTKVNNRMIDGAVVNVQDFGADPTGVEFSDSAFQAAYNHAGDTGRPVYIPSGTYLLELKSSITPINSLGDTIKNFVCFGDGRSSIIKYDVDADPNYRSPFSLSTSRQVDGLEIYNLAVDFNEQRTRPTPTSRLHNPFVQCVGGGKNVYLHDLYLMNANVDQPIRLAHLDVGNVYIENIRIENVEFDTFHDGVAGANQLDISCMYIYGEQVNITGCYFNSRIPDMSVESSKGITAIEFYGKDFLISNNHYEKVNRAHIVGNLDSSLATRNIVISSNLFKEVICCVDGAAVGTNLSSNLTFQNNTVVNRDMGNALSLPSLLFFSIPTGNTVYWRSVEVLGNTFDYEGTGSLTTSAYSSVFGGGSIPYFRFDSNTVSDAPTGVINYYVDDAAEADVDIFITNNKFRSIATGEQQGGSGRPFSFNSIGSKTFRNWIMDNNLFENIYAKANRGGTGGNGPIMYMNVATTGKNLSFSNNGVLGANIPRRTDGNWTTPSNEVIQNNYNLADTD